MTQNPYSPQDQQPSSQQPSPQPAPPFSDQPMNIYPAPGAYGAAYPGQQAGKPSWPTVVGIISLCVAGLFSLMTIGSLAIGAVVQNNPQQRRIMADMPEWVVSWQYKAISGTFTIGAYVVLAIGGVMLLKRRPAGRTLHVAYVLMGIVLAIAGSVVALMMMGHMPATPNAPPQVDAIQKITTVVGLVIGLAFALAYPTFVLIWFTRPKVKQHIKTWQS